MVGDDGFYAGPEPAINVSRLPVGHYMAILRNLDGKPSLVVPLMIAR